MKHFTSLKYFSGKQIKALLELALKVKKRPSVYKSKLKNKYVGLIFQKPSLRTKTSFYVGALQLGAQVVYYAPDEVKIGEREKISDVARTLSGYLDSIVVRTFSHKVIEEFAQNSAVAVINALSNLLHPSQVLGDLMTLAELKKDVKKIKFTYIGDGNNVCHSLLYAFSILGGNICIAHPCGYNPQDQVLEECYKLAKKSGAKISLTNEPADVAKEADVLYTDVWSSMGKESEREQRRKIFRDFQINEELLALAKKDCLVMHCLPAHRGEEITDSVIDGKNAVVFLQAENRLHSAKAILLSLLAPK
ncbi:MAG: ornithine carbamoyltransferase [Candidatus Omnitrophota bacterium]|nr:MAG: ornithine carbamoyltransferase [Candidatus Omnitrophota bacterium]